jgi:hypothetical protein
MLRRRTSRVGVLVLSLAAAAAFADVAHAGLPGEAATTTVSTATQPAVETASEAATPVVQATTPPQPAAPPAQVPPAASTAIEIATTAAPIEHATAAAATSVKAVEAAAQTTTPRISSATTTLVSRANNTATTAIKATADTTDSAVGALREVRETVVPASSPRSPAETVQAAAEGSGVPAQSGAAPISAASSSTRSSARTHKATAALDRNEPAFAPPVSGGSTMVGVGAPVAAEPSTAGSPQLPPPSPDHGLGTLAAFGGASGGSPLLFAFLTFGFLLTIPNAVRWLRSALALGLSSAYVAIGDRPG